MVAGVPQQGQQGAHRRLVDVVDDQYGAVRARWRHVIGSDQTEFTSHRDRVEPGGDAELAGFESLPRQHHGSRGLGIRHAEARAHGEHGPAEAVSAGHDGVRGAAHLADVQPRALLIPLAALTVWAEGHLPAKASERTRSPQRDRAGSGPRWPERARDGQG